MCTRYIRRSSIGAKREDELLIELLTSWAVILQGSPDSFDRVDVEFGLIRPTNTFATRASVCSSVRRERSTFPCTVITLHGPGILSFR